MRKSRLSGQKQSSLIEHFVAGTTARAAAAMVGVNKSTSAYYFHRLRKLIYKTIEDDAPIPNDFEVDESCFRSMSGPSQQQEINGKILVFSLLNNGCRIYTKIIPGIKTSKIIPAFKEYLLPDSIFYIDALPDKNVLDVADFRHYKIKHLNLFADSHNYLNGIENFWNQAKRYLRKFNGVPQNNFHLYWKEFEWRFNNPDPADQLHILKQLVAENMS